MGGPLGRGNNNFNNDNRRNVNANDNWSSDSEMTLTYNAWDFLFSGIKKIVHGYPVHWIYLYFSSSSYCMRRYNDLYEQLTSYENLELAFTTARKRKTLKDYVIEFEADLKQNLSDLQFELQTFTYQPRSIKTFIVKDPKTRKISASDFRDRVIHHALCNVISPILGDGFIFDSFANRKGKGTHPAIKRFEKFLKKVAFAPSKVKTGGGGGADFWVLSEST